jgi:hypothetical protein
MSHKCAKPGCGFHLPESYPLPYCPWHAAPGSGIVKVIAAAGIFAVGVGGMYAVSKVSEAFKKRKTQAEQEEWRQRAEEMRKARRSPDEDVARGA